MDRDESSRAGEETYPPHLSQYETRFDWPVDGLDTSGVIGLTGNNPDSNAIYFTYTQTSEGNVNSRTWLSHSGQKGWIH